MSDKYLLFDIGGTFIKSALLDNEETLVMLDKVATPDTLEDFTARLESIISAHIDEISGIGLACPGRINVKTGYVYQGGLISHLKNFPLGEHLTEKFQKPVAVLNDANAAGLAEAKSGHLNDIACGAVLVLGTGVGGAILINGELLSARHLTTGELKDKLNLKSDKPMTWEERLKMMELYGHGFDSLMSNYGSAVQFVTRASSALKLDEADGQAVFEQLNATPSLELQTMFSDYCREIAYLILNLQSIFKLEKLLIGGGISSQPLLLQEINQQYQKLLAEESTLGQHFDKQFPIEACYYHNEANLMGAYYQLQDQLTLSKQ